ncbi:MAG: cupin domain-containing protein [Alphaproteobacteria bacterium]|nr:cupin domain-containing protein [Alphaproteobacteria bacterium]
MSDAKTKTEGAYKAGDGAYVFDVDALQGLMAGPGYAETFGPVVEGELTQVGVMTLPAGQTSEPHTHPNEQWIYVLKGELHATVDGQESDVGPGHLIYIPADTVHSVTVSPDGDCHFFTAKDLRSGIAGTKFEG